MDSEQARNHVVEAFRRIENSGPIYSGDNLEMLHVLGPVHRREFVKCRHSLSKMAMTGHLERQDLIESFKRAVAGRL